MKEVLPSQWLPSSLLFESNIKNCKPIAGYLRNIKNFYKWIHLISTCLLMDYFLLYDQYRVCISTPGQHYSFVEVRLFFVGLNILVT